MPPSPSVVPTTASLSRDGPSSKVGLHHLMKLKILSVVFENCRLLSAAYCCLPHTWVITIAELVRKFL